MNFPVNLPQSSTQNPYLSRIDGSVLSQSDPSGFSFHSTQTDEHNELDNNCKESKVISPKKYKKYAEIIQEDLVTLKQMRREESSLISCQKLEVLYRLKNNPSLSITHISELIGVSRVTVQRWLKIYQETGIKGLLTPKKRVGRPRKLEAKVREVLANKLAEKTGEFVSYKQIQAWLEESYHIELEYKTLYHLVRYEMNASLKSPSGIILVNSERSI